MDQQLFKTTRSTSSRLDCLGYSAQFPHTSCQVALASPLAATVHKALLTIHTPLTKKQLNDLDQQQHYAPVQKFNSRGSPKWRAALPHLAQQYRQHYTTPQARFAIAHDTLSCIEKVLFVCPQAHNREATQQVFSVKQPSRAVWCLVCKHSWGGRKWNCACNISWAECPIHYNSVPVGPLKQKSAIPTFCPQPQSAAQKVTLRERV